MASVRAHVTAASCMWLKCLQNDKNLFNHLFFLLQTRKEGYLEPSRNRPLCRDLEMRMSDLHF
jgi:hypothetical protein